MKGEDETYVVRMRLPEVRKEDVQVELRDAFVTIRVPKPSAAVLRGRPWARRDALTHSFRLPTDADPERLEASFDDGTLTLRIHRIDVRPRRTVELH